MSVQYERVSDEELSKWHKGITDKHFITGMDIVPRLIESLIQSRQDSDMAGSIFQEIKEGLKHYPCMHKAHANDSTPPMFYTEWISCVISKARIQGMEAMRHALREKGKLLEIVKEDAKSIWDDYIKERYPNEMEGTN